MFPRRICPNCGKSVALGSANQIRSHFCPHYKTCEMGSCEKCADARREERPSTASSTGANDV